MRPLIKEKKIRERALIVEDDWGLRTLVGEFLQGEGYEVEEAFDGLEGLEKFRASNFHVLLVDQQMPRLSGLQLVEQILELPPKERPVLILISGKLSPEQVQDINGKKFRDLYFLRKPFGFSDLLRVIKVGLLKRRFLNLRKALRPAKFKPGYIGG